MNYLVKAIFNLKPGSEFKLENDDYSTIEWIVIDGTAPTKQEVDAEIIRLIEQDEIEKNNKAVAKAALLTQLGITEEQAKLLLS